MNIRQITKLDDIKFITRQPAIKRCLKELCGLDNDEHNYIEIVISFDEDGLIEQVYGNKGDDTYEPLYQ